MPSAQAIINKLNATLTRTNAGERTVYKRVVTETGGDKLIGRPGTVTNTDTLLSPQPFFSRLGRDRVPGGHASAETVIDSTGRMVLADDYQVMISPTAMTRDDLSNAQVQLVLVDSAGRQEVLKIDDFIPTVFQGTDCMFLAFCRSVTRP